MRRGVLTEMACEEGVELVAEELTNCRCDCRPRGARLEAGNVRLRGVRALARKEEDAAWLRRRFGRVLSIRGRRDAADVAAASEAPHQHALCAASWCGLQQRAARTARQLEAGGAREDDARPHDVVGDERAHRAGGGRAEDDDVCVLLPWFSRSERAVRTQTITVDLHVEETVTSTP